MGRALVSLHLSAWVKLGAGLHEATGAMEETCRGSHFLGCKS